MHACLYACTHACIHACMHAYTHAYIHTCMHAYIHTHTNIHTYMRHRAFSRKNNCQLKQCCTNSSAISATHLQREEGWGLRRPNNNENP